MSKFYFVEIKQDEMKSQIEDLTQIIEEKQKERKEKRSKIFEFIIGVLGLIIALASLERLFRVLCHRLIVK